LERIEIFGCDFLATVISKPRLSLAVLIATALLLLYRMSGWR
jgi:hypothetical protein